MAALFECLAVSWAPVGRRRLVLAVALSCDVDYVALVTRPFLCLQLSISGFHDVPVNDYYMVRYTGSLIVREWTIFYICRLFGHIYSPIWTRRNAVGRMLRRIHYLQFSVCRAGLVRIIDTKIGDVDVAE